jgi:UDP-glucose 4-epimerase
VRVLVTGGAGFIGSHTVRELVEAGHEPRVLDDLSRGHRGAVPAGVPLVQADLGTEEEVLRALDGVECVVHFAGLLSVAESVRDPLAYHRTNVAKGIALLSCAVRAGVRRLIFSSSCAVYGVPETVPIDEGTPTNAISPYGASKAGFERALRDCAEAGLIQGVALRYFNAAGCHADGSLGEDHRPEEHLIPLAIDAALGRRAALTLHGDDYPTPDGTCVRDYIHVQDLARAHVLALAADLPPFRALNLGTGGGHSVREVIDAVARVGGRKVPVVVGPRRVGDPPALVASSGRAAAELRFEPAFRGIEPIVETAWAWRVKSPGGYPP